MGKIYISTGGFSHQTGIESFDILKSKKIKFIELSGGKYCKNFNKHLLKLKNNCLFHNYFPPPKKPFVFNLSSKNKKIAQSSIALVKRNIINSKKIKAKYYSFHAGFCVDPKPRELGQKIKKTKILDRKKAENIFLNRLIRLNKFALKNNVQLLIENNVVTKKNKNIFKQNPFLLTSPDEILKFFERLKKAQLNIGLLLDTGHLKVSSKTLGFNLKEGHQKLKKIITAYHVSDNNGLVDSNHQFSENCWFLKSLKKSAKYFTIEVYNANYKTYFKLIKILKSYL